jgi:hypothetical protein
MNLPPPDVCTLIASLMPLESRIQFNQCLHADERFSKRLPREVCQSHHMMRLVKQLKDTIRRLELIRGNSIVSLKKRVSILEKIYSTFALSKDLMWDCIPAKLCLGMLRGLNHLEIDMVQ